MYLCHDFLFDCPSLFCSMNLFTNMKSLNVFRFFCSSQVLFSISQKLIQHQIYNYTEILKWLREILICRNNFLQKHKDYAYVGSNIRICRQAHIKLEVCKAFVSQPKLRNVCKQRQKLIVRVITGMSQINKFLFRLSSSCIYGA